MISKNKNDETPVFINLIKTMQTWHVFIKAILHDVSAMFMCDHGLKKTTYVKPKKKYHTF